MSLLDALSKMTMLPANRLGLKNKGQLKQGMDADITIFDKDLIIDNATYLEPTKAPSGIEYVIVNGEIALFKDELVNPRLGKAIRRKETNYNTSTNI